MDAFFTFAQMFFENVWLYGASFLLVLTILVFVHEWGHFIVARLCGVRVEVFSIGFGKEVWGYTAKNGTRWKFSLLPLGGYVKMFGDADPASAGHDEAVAYSEEDKKVAFFTQPVWKRASIVAAGPGINFVFAIILLAGLFAFNGKVEVAPVVTAVQIGSPAEEAGFMPHDRVLEINGKKARRFGDITRSVTIALDDEMTFLVDRDGEQETLTVKPERIVIEGRFDQEIGRIGVLGPSSGFLISEIDEINGVAMNEENIAATRQAIDKNLNNQFTVKFKSATDDNMAFKVAPSREANASIADQESPMFDALILVDGPYRTTVKYGPVEALGEGVSYTWGVTVDTMRAMGQIFSGTRSLTELGGVIRIASFAGDMAQQGLIALIIFTALISINLGLINLFPIPLLDGGHLVMYAVEAVKGKPVSEKTQEYAFRAGMTFLIFLMVFANLNDILQLIL